MHRATALMLILLVCLAVHLNTGGGGLVQALPIGSAGQLIAAVKRRLPHREYLWFSLEMSFLATFLTY